MDSGTRMERREPHRYRINRHRGHRRAGRGSVAPSWHAIARKSAVRPALDPARWTREGGDTLPSRRLTFRCCAVERIVLPPPTFCFSKIVQLRLNTIVCDSRIPGPIAFFDGTWANHANGRIRRGCSGAGGRLCGSASHNASQTRRLATGPCHRKRPGPDLYLTSRTRPSPSITRHRLSACPGTFGNADGDRCTGRCCVALPYGCNEAWHATPDVIGQRCTTLPCTRPLIITCTFIVALRVRYEK